MPTRGRVNKQSTLQRLRPEIRKMVNVYCHPGEMDLFRKLYSDQVASIQEYDKDCTHIGEIREYILFNSNSKNVIFMDDNLRFQSRNVPRDTSLKSNIFEMTPKNYSEEELLNMQIEIFDWMLLL